MTFDSTERLRPADLPASVFAILAQEFFDTTGAPVPFSLAGKGNTQDDPFDRHVAEILKDRLPADSLVVSAHKPLVSPDVVIARPEEYDLLTQGGADYDTRAIFGLEVKKVNLTANRTSARGSGMDYNTTPPCATIRVYTNRGKEIRIPGFYLFVVLEKALSPGDVFVHSLALVAGAALNKDVELYDKVTGRRKKAIDLGTYGDGLDRQRPMLVFSNPLGWSWMLNAATLISERDDLAMEQPITLVREIVRTTRLPDVAETFHCYRLSALHPALEEPAVDPFPQPKNRTEETTPRGRFVVNMGSLMIESETLTFD
ncbi:hypothetical protein [Nonomuraea typhae]|uniref:hypothetical protein n=1 Tax=Nonomuraea typhae TaxID=2603600 RepID=UPI0012FB74F0|nr:hypothetical protein [Nonomuraea typhae]